MLLAKGQAHAQLLLQEEQALRMTTDSPTRLSICIGTYNRAEYIRATLDSVISQLERSCEIVISDNASTDDTESIVLEYKRHCDQLRYYRNDTNLGIDRNFDNAIVKARGEYCWLMSDDDLMKPGAIARVLQALDHATSLVVANIEYRDLSMSKVLQRRAVNYRSDRFYGPAELDRLFADIAEDQLVAYIGNLIVKRDFWRSRERDRYFGSLMIHIGVIYQGPLPQGALFISEPLVSVRVGNVHSYSTSAGEILFNKWPNLLASLPISRSARRRAPGAEPTRQYAWLLKLRGFGFYSSEEYARWIRPRLASLPARLIHGAIAAAPFMLVNTLLTVCYFLRPHGGRARYGLRAGRELARQQLSASQKFCT